MSSINSIDNNMSMLMMRGTDSENSGKKRFARLDSNGDGGIDVEEFSQIAEKRNLNVEDIFAKYDENQDGKLDETEEKSVFAAYGPKSEQGSLNDKDALQALVSNIDQSVMDKFGQRSAQPSGDSDRFNLLDADRSGGIDKSEFAVVTERTGLNVDDVFTKFDTNQDNLLDETEEKASFEDFRAQQEHNESNSEPLSLVGMPESNKNSDEIYKNLLAALVQNAVARYGNTASMQMSQISNNLNVQA